MEVRTLFGPEGPIDLLAVPLRQPSAEALRWESSAKRTTPLPQDDKPVLVDSRRIILYIQSVLKETIWRN